MARIKEDAPEPKADFGVRGISRRSFMKSTSAVTAAMILPTFSKPSVAKGEAISDMNTFVCVGNFASKPASWDAPQPTGKGFGIFRYDKTTGELELIKSTVMDKIGVGATCLDSKRKILYCTHEFMTQPGYFRGGGGLVYALAINPQTGDLTEINHQPSYGSLPSYLAVDATGKYLIVVTHTGNTPITRTEKDPSGKYRIVVEYDEAATILFRLNHDGSIGDPCDIYKHSGSGPDAEQSHPRVHSVMMSPSGKLFAVCDKGADRLYFFRINRQTEKLEVCGGEGYKSFPGSLPRYGVFHPTAPYFFMNHEVKPVISIFRYDEDGKLEFIHAVDVLPEGSKIDRTTMQSDIRIHPSGKYLYDLIRGSNVVSVFAVQEKTGEIELIQTVKLEGGAPRGCVVSPDGRFLYVALTSIQKVVILAIGEDGKVNFTGKSVGQPSPGNVTFFPA
jgi:6-phosphogluconolactonase